MRILPFVLLGCLVGGCSAAQEAAFSKSFTGQSTPLAPGQPPSPKSVEGITGTIATGAATVAAATVGTPASGIAAIVAAAASGLLFGERLLAGLVALVKNSGSSQSPSTAGSAGGTPSPGGPPSALGGLKAA